MSFRDISDDEYQKLKEDFVYNNVLLCRRDKCAFAGNCKFESGEHYEEPCPLLVKAMYLFFDRYRRNIDWTKDEEVDLLKETAKTYMDILSTQINYTVGLSISPETIMFYGGDTQEKKSESKENFRIDSWAAKHSIEQFAKLIKMLKKLRSNDTIREAVIIDSDDSLMISIGKLKKT